MSLLNEAKMPRLKDKIDAKAEELEKAEALRKKKEKEDEEEAKGKGIKKDIKKSARNK